MNPRYQQMNNQPNSNIIQRFQQFKQSFSGNPQQIVQQMLDSGKISQERYNQAVQIANQLQNILK